MTIKEFWQLIDRSKRKDDQAEWLTEALLEKGESGIISFEFHLQSLLNESYKSSLWAAAYIIMGGCSDDSFDYFRGWLISRGQKVYDKTMENHEYLAKYIKESNLNEEEVPEYEELLAVGFDAYLLLKTGDSDWNDELHDAFLDSLERMGLQQQPAIDLDWDDEDEEQLAGMYPKLWKRFGEEPLGY